MKISREFDRAMQAEKIRDGYRADRARIRKNRHALIRKTLVKYDHRWLSSWLDDDDKWKLTPLPGAGLRDTINIIRNGEPSQ